MRNLLWLAVLAIVLAGWSSAQNPTRASWKAGEPFAAPALVLGTAWYPEHWDEARWEQDLALMQAAGINMVRIAEFAWSRMEPQEGRFDFDWLERAVALAAKHNIKVVLGTPTAAPPAWLTQKYPDTLAVWEDGQRATHGNRGHYRVTSTRYLEFCRRIAAEMAKRFGHNPNVIGWQIDNEYGPVSYDDETRQRLQEFLQARYKTLDALNGAWTTAYWSQTYDNWQEIPIPIGGHNPGLMLEWRRFITETFRAYQHNQVEAIRANADPRQFITHNFMNFYGGFDHYVLSQELTLASWDSYIGSGHMDASRTGQTHDLTRGFKRQNFWVMETQPGSVNWAGVNNVLDRGEVRRMAWQAVGHGADAVSYWQWRSALGGQEQYHGSLVGPDDNPRPVYQEVSQLGREFAKAAGALQGTSPTPQTAILYDWDSRWAIEFQRHHQDFDPTKYLYTFYKPLRAATQDVDIVHPSAPLGQYRLVVAPALNVLPEAIAQHLAEYVRGGGHLVIGARSGMKDEHNALQPARQPGKILASLLGGDVVEFYALDTPAPVSGDVGMGEARVWAEMLETKDPATEVLLRFGKSNGWLDGQPAVVSRRVGAGRITYVGGQFDEGLMAALAQWMVRTSGVTPVLKDVPQGVEVCRRVGKGKEVLVVINHTAQPQTVTLGASMREVFKGKGPVAVLALPGHDVAVLARID